MIFAHFLAEYQPRRLFAILIRIVSSCHMTHPCLVIWAIAGLLTCSVLCTPDVSSPLVRSYLTRKSQVKERISLVSSTLLDIQRSRHVGSLHYRKLVEIPTNIPHYEVPLQVRKTTAISSTGISTPRTRSADRRILHSDRAILPT